MVCVGIVSHLVIRVTLTLFSSAVTAIFLINCYVFSSKPSLSLLNRCFVWINERDTFSLPLVRIVTRWAWANRLFIVKIARNDQILLIIFLELYSLFFIVLRGFRIYFRLLKLMDRLSCICWVLDGGNKVLLRLLLLVAGSVLNLSSLSILCLTSHYLGPVQLIIDQWVLTGMVWCNSQHFVTSQDQINRAFIYILVAKIVL